MMEGDTVRRGWTHTVILGEAHTHLPPLRYESPRSEEGSVDGSPVACCNNNVISDPCREITVSSLLAGPNERSANPVAELQCFAKAYFSGMEAS